METRLSRVPIGSYFSGNGAEVLAAMRKTYGSPEKAKRVFYATANKTGQAAGRRRRRRKRK